MAKMLRWVFVPSLVIGITCCVYAQEEKKEDAAQAKPLATKPAAGDMAQLKPAQETATTPEDDTEEKKQEETKTETAAKPAETAAAKPEEKKEEKPAETKTSETTETKKEPEAPAPTPEPEKPAEPPQWEEVVAVEQEDVAPEVPQQDSEQQSDGSADDEVMGIDTVDLADPQGNWLYKRVWWERAEAKYEKIREVVNKVLEVRTSFFAKRAELDKNVLDPFYMKIGISQGELQEILKELLAKVEKLISNTESESLADKAEADKKILQDLQKQVEQVVNQDEEVEKAIMMLVAQITKIRGIEQQAWQDFKGIARVLDDRKARELFYKVDAAWRNIKDLQQYIEQKFAGSFDQLIAKVKDEVKRVEQEMAAVRESGIDLQKRLLSTEKAQLEAQRRAQEEEDEQDEEPGFFTRYIINPIKAVFEAVWSVITWPINKIFGTADSDDEDEQEVEVTETVTTEAPEIKTEVTVTEPESTPREPETPVVEKEDETQEVTTEVGATEPQEASETEQEPAPQEQLQEADTAQE